MNPEQQTARRRRRTPAELKQLAAEQTSSGMTIIEFCRCRGISRSTVDRALRHLRNQTATAGRGTQLVAVEVAGVTRGGTPGNLTVVLAHGRRIEVPCGFDVATLQRLVSALERG